MKQQLILAFALALAACEGVPLPMATADADAAGKQFASPRDGMAALYVFRDRAGPNVSLSAGQRNLGTLGGRNWLRVDLPSGTHDVRCTVPSLNDAVASAAPTLRPGQVAYYSASVDLFAGCILKPEEAPIAQPSILAGKRVRELL